MKLYEITTQCGAKIQTAKLTDKESNPVIQTTECPIICNCCGHVHGLEVCTVKEVNVNG
jgi:hypothetical protein